MNLVSSPMSNVIRGIVLVSSVSAIMVLSACSQDRPASERWRHQAPQSQQDSGIVVELNNKNQAIDLRNQIDMLMKKFDNLEVREISLEHGMYEFHNINSQKLMQELAKFEVNSYQNIYFDNLIPAKTRSNTQHIRSFRGSECLESDKAPTASIAATNALTATLNVPDPVIDIKDGPVGFSSQPSKSLQTDITLDRVWIVEGPVGSTFEFAAAESPGISFQPDIPGVYTVQLAVQDTVLNCGFTAKQFAVTSNEVYNGVQIPRVFDVVTDKAQFFHLDEIGALEAWKKAKGAKITIAIVDSGVSYNHPDLAANIVTHPTEIPDNDFDDDGNGKKDDVLGWDFINNDNKPQDDNQHGTHVAGLAASAVSGVAPDAKILAIKVMSAYGSGDLASIIAGIKYAADRGAQIINLSLGMDTFGMSPMTVALQRAEYQKAISYAQTKNAIVVAASGNGYPYIPIFGPIAGLGYDTDKYESLPSSIKSANLVSVAAVDSSGNLTDYSNYGLKTVHVAAPGGVADSNPADTLDDSKLLMSTYYAPSAMTYVGLDGTSMAAPVVAGALAVIKSAYPNASMATLISAMQSSVTKKTSLATKIKSGGVINIPATLKTLSILPVTPLVLN